MANSELISPPDRISAGYEDRPGRLPQTIVAEVSKNWPGDPEDLLSMRFEEVIEVNRERGYQLQSWHLSRVYVEEALNETIIAVFVWEKVAEPDGE
jgi:hypothetical protein